MLDHGALFPYVFWHDPPLHAKLGGGVGASPTLALRRPRPLSPACPPGLFLAACAPLCPLPLPCLIRGMAEGMP
eukprot:4842781-Pyramimonas_sp.AAC.1